MTVAFDLCLCLTLLGLACSCLRGQDLFAATILYICFGLLMAMGWLRLQAPDLALAEAAIGAGLTGALFLSALRRLRAARPGDRRLDREEQRGPHRQPQGRQRRLATACLALLAALFLSTLAWGLLMAPAPASQVSRQLSAELAVTGVQSRVTAILLNFRAYDTLLECFVLFAGVVAVWSLVRPRHGSPLTMSPLLASLLRQLLPLLVLFGCYLLWAGSSQAGGAFQSGAILAGAAVLLLLTGSPLLFCLPQRLLFWGLIMGPGLFLTIASLTMLAGRSFLHYRGLEASRAILLLEIAAACSIALSLAALFGGRPPGQDEPVVKPTGEGDC